MLLILQEELYFSHPLITVLTQIIMEETSTLVLTVFYTFQPVMAAAAETRWRMHKTPHLSWERFYV
jgi:hypothetical protein